MRAQWNSKHRCALLSRDLIREKEKNITYLQLFKNLFTYALFFPFSDILRMDSTNADALYVRGLCLYYEDCIDKAVQFFVQALRMAPDHDKARLACRVSEGVDHAQMQPNLKYL